MVEIWPLLALLTAVLLAGWAGVLALAEEAPSVPRALGDPPTAPREVVPLYRAAVASRLALLLLAGAAGAGALEWWRRPALDAVMWAAVGVVFLFLIGEALPRALGVLAPRLATWVAPFARASLVPFRPLLGVVGAVERRLHELLPPARRRREGVRHEARDILAGVLSLQETTVAEIMTPRLDVAAVDSRSSWRELVEVLRKSEHARLPVFDGDLDEIAGVLYAKDLMPAVAGVASVPDEWHQFIRPAQFVPESKTLAAQLRDFQRGPAHLAIVVDEFGGTSGLVTLEDVLEEVVGEIHGEYDAEEEPEIVREGDDRFWVDGTVSLDQLGNVLGVEFEEEDVSTVGGLVYAEIGRVPHPGEELRIGDFRVVVEKIERRRIHRVYFERRRDASTVQATTEDAE